MKKLIKIFKSKYWDLFPVLPFFLIASLEGKGYWIAGVSLVIWFFSLAIRNFVK